MEKTQPKISLLLDVGPAVHQNAGLARYAEQLALHLLAHHTQQLDLTLFYNAHSGHQLPEPLRSAPTQTLAMSQYPWRLTALASQLLSIPFGRITRKSKIQNPKSKILYHATEHLLPYLRSPSVLTVHDLIFERYPEHHTRSNRLFLKLAMPRFVKAADAIIAVSQQTRRDLIDLYDTPTEKVHVIYQGIDPRFRSADPAQVSRVQQQYSPARPYLLMVGTLEPRKNHALALEALARLKAAGLPHRLLVVGGKGWLFEPILQKVESLGLAADVTFCGYVPIDDLVALYSGADCVLVSSLYEGFGFPVIEAMACGAPVVCSNTSSLPEVAGDAALQVDPLDGEALASAIRRVLEEPGLADALREKGVDQAAKFSWQRCAAQTVEVYRFIYKGIN